jgi:aryl-alcohol dehydrogenase-like predicted oxidoreductase
MQIVGVDLHARQQTISMLDTATGEIVEKTLEHAGDVVQELTLNSYVTLGRSGLRVSPFCLGAMTFGKDLGPGFGSSVEDSETILAHYLEQGGNFIDTANGYTRGHSEKIIGDFFRQGKRKRDRAVIATKFFMNPHARNDRPGADYARSDSRARSSPT